MNKLGSYGKYKTRFVCKKCRRYTYSITLCGNCGYYSNVEIGRWKTVGRTYFLGFVIFNKYEWEPKV